MGQMTDALLSFDTNTCLYRKEHLMLRNQFYCEFNYNDFAIAMLVVVYGK